MDAKMDGAPPPPPYNPPPPQMSGAQPLSMGGPPPPQPGAYPPPAGGPALQGAQPAMQSQAPAAMLPAVVPPEVMEGTIMNFVNPATGQIEPYRYERYPAGCIKCEGLTTTGWMITIILVLIFWPAAFVVCCMKEMHGLRPVPVNRPGGAVAMAAQ